MVVEGSLGLVTLICNADGDDLGFVGGLFGGWLGFIGGFMRVHWRFIGGSWEVYWRFFGGLMRFHFGVDYFNCNLPDVDI